MRVLVVEDDLSVRETLTDLLSAAGHSVTAAAGFGEAVAMLAQARWDVLLADLVLPGGSGLALAAQAQARGMGAVICSGHPQSIGQMERQGIAHLVKPFSAAALEEALAAVAPGHG